MFSYTRVFFVLIITAFFYTNCSVPNSATMTISGTIDYVGDASVTVSKVPLHYKYSPKINYPLEISADGTFKTTIPIENEHFLTLSIDDNSFLLIADANDDLTLVISRSDFPNGIEINSIHNKDYTAYQNYLAETDGLDKQIEKEMNKYKAGEEHSAITLSQKKIDLASKHLANTAYKHFILKAKGEMLVNKIKSVEYRLYDEGFNADKERSEIMAQAKKDGFFTLQSLVAQRAGIRDVTHYYARTFGIYDSVNSTYGTELAEYDIKRIAYDELNKKRLEVLDYIEDRQALAYAELFLAAERIGELKLATAEPGYRNYLKEYSDFPEYTSFLTYFYNEIQSVSPGEPAIPFTLADASGNTHTLEDYAGKYILLDFWAGWCQPCLDEFPKMTEIYSKYSRNDFEILGISTEIDKDVWRSDIEKFQNPWPQLYGGKGFDQETFRAYKGGGIPFYILVDPDGKIARYNDIRATFNLEEVLDELIPQ